MFTIRKAGPRLWQMKRLQKKPIKLSTLTSRRSWINAQAASRRSSQFHVLHGLDKAIQQTVEGFVYFDQTWKKNCREGKAPVVPKPPSACMAWWFYEDECGTRTIGLSLANCVRVWLPRRYLPCRGRNPESLPWPGIGKKEVVAMYCLRYVLGSGRRNWT